MIFSVLFIILGLIVYLWSKQFYIEQTRNSLLSNVEIISYQLDKTNLDKLVKKVNDSLDLRLTIISANGKILAESLKDKTTMDNHSQRKEIIEANKKAFGFDIRLSKTLHEKLLYVAKKVAYNKSFIYVRLSTKLGNIDEQIIELGVKIFGVLTLFFIVVFLTTLKLGKEIEKEINKIVVFLKSLTKKEKSTYLSSSFSEEFSYITKLLTKISQILVKKDKQKAKYTTKLQLANKQKDDIISAISHEFKNPIAVINGYTQTLIEDEKIKRRIRSNSK